jgi:hypothetical protein
MKRKRGRPPGKKFPQPDNIFKGMWNATFGKVGASEAMHVVMGCPYRGSPRIESLPQRRRYFKTWNAKVGQLIGEKIGTGDHAFFRDLAIAIETLNKNEDPHSIERSIALDYRLDCEMSNQPFTLKGLRAEYRRLGKKQIAEDSSKLSKIYRWAKSAKWRKLPYLPAVRRSGEKMPF